MSPREKPGFGKLLVSEAAAYFRSGLLAAGGARSVRHNAAGTSEFGVLFVPGVGANASQFASLKQTLSDEADWFDAFEYTSLSHPKSIAAALRDHISLAGQRCTRILVIGHSMGGLLARTALQHERAPINVAGFVSICAPLHGTWRSKLSPNPRLHLLAPDSPFVREVIDTADRLHPWKGSILTIGARYDQFVAPYGSAFLEGHEQLVLDDAGHVASLFDRRVHDAIAAMARRIKKPPRPAEGE